MARVVVIGLAETGIAVARRLHAEGADVVVLEDAPAPTARYNARVDELAQLGVELIEQPDDARTRALAAAADLVVPSPLVRPTHSAIAAAQAAGVPVRSEIDLAAERASMPIVAVTGTNGKTTVTSMIAAMLEASGRRALAAGNIGRPLLDAIGDDVDVIVAEVSSFQLAFSPTFRPRVAVLLAVTPDHLDWHGGFDDYAAAKARIAASQRDDDLLVYDADDPRARAIAAHPAARVQGVSVRSDAEECFRVVGDDLVFPDGRVLAPIATMKRALGHDRTNALAAAAAALEAGAHVDGIRATLANYETMRHRVELVGEAIGVRWYDDSKATNPDAVLRAVASFDSVVLLAGGRNKGLDLSVLASVSEHLRAVVAFGEAALEVAAAFAGRATVVTVDAMHDAVSAARDLAQPGDVVLLSPACASFDAYESYAARGDDFAAEVRALRATEGSTR
jgi:UDP-N-acetylmuramoylalanine--D-glutamate ligase